MSFPRDIVFLSSFQQSEPASEKDDALNSAENKKIE